MRLRFYRRFNPDQIVARIGGDEFVMILPDTTGEVAVEYIKQIHALIKLNNKYYREPELSISLGAATSKPDMTLEKVINMADDTMYRYKSDLKQRRKDD
ncbi:diguanylate cyclase [Candidatus Villigracilis proximus]|uniref:diguanylate cyclase n=1 Tax=Candidatus Villigracilis proximus TaxID=3140683 RepID=UPI0031E80C30